MEITAPALPELNISFNETNSERLTPCVGAPASARIQEPVHYIMTT